MEDSDPDTDTEDADTSTDAGRETDEEPTIRAPLVQVLWVVVQVWEVELEVYGEINWGRRDR